MIQAASYLVNLEQVIKGADEVGGMNREDELESAIKEDRGKKGEDFETVEQEDFFEQLSSSIWKKLGRRIQPHPTN